ncbi:MAG TPA: ATP-binding protein [Actinomycetota bacterium]|nr:ATP-binding protein [Actinomycetota bacterium]
MTLRSEANAAEGFERRDEMVEVAGDPGERVPHDRLRLAYALHDGLTQVITATVLELESLAHRAEISPAEASGALRQGVVELRKALDEIRGVLANLAPTTPGVAQPIEDLLRSVLDRWQLPATWSIEGDLAEVSPSVLEAASSVIREGIANAAKHADGRGVAVRVLASDRSLEVSVEDHGRGFEGSNSDPVAGHLGLDMLRRRVADVHGTLDVRSAPGEGTRVVARLPRYGQGDNP